LLQFPDRGQNQISGAQSCREPLLAESQNSDNNGNCAYPDSNNGRFKSTCGTLNPFDSGRNGLEITAQLSIACVYLPNELSKFGVSFRLCESDFGIQFGGRNWIAHGLILPRRLRRNWQWRWLGDRPSLIHRPPE
jgi:hypothetical protein